MMNLVTSSLRQLNNSTFALFIHFAGKEDVSGDGELTHLGP